MPTESSGPLPGVQTFVNKQCETVTTMNTDVESPKFYEEMKTFTKVDTKVGQGCNADGPDGRNILGEAINVTVVKDCNLQDNQRAIGSHDDKRAIGQPEVVNTTEIMSDASNGMGTSHEALLEIKDNDEKTSAMTRFHETTLPVKDPEYEVIEKKVGDAVADELDSIQLSKGSKISERANEIHVEDSRREDFKAFEGDQSNDASNIGVPVEKKDMHNMKVSIGASFQMQTRSSNDGALEPLKVAEPQEVVKLENVSLDPKLDLQKPNLLMQQDLMEVDVQLGKETQVNVDETLAVDQHLSNILDTVIKMERYAATTYHSLKRNLSLATRCRSEINNFSSDVVKATKRVRKLSCHLDNTLLKTETEKEILRMEDACVNPKSEEYRKHVEMQINSQGLPLPMQREPKCLKQPMTHVIMPQNPNNEKLGESSPELPSQVNRYTAEKEASSIRTIRKKKPIFRRVGRHWFVVDNQSGHQSWRMV